jgi:glycosyltransferase involved in cell wall biosynthesis
MKSAHILALPSLKEGTPHVVLEALSLGLPVICHDACGMGIAVTDACGIKIPLHDPETSINGFKDAIRDLFEHPEKVEELSRGALKRAEELSWDKKVDAIARAYSEICPIRN